MGGNGQNETDDNDGELLSFKAQHDEPSCWVTPIGNSKNNVTRPFLCSDHLLSHFSYENIGEFKNIPRTARGIAGRTCEFRIQWTLCKEKIFDDNGNQLNLVKDSVRSQIILCRAEVINSCHALTPREWKFIENSSIPVSPIKLDVETVNGYNSLYSENDLPPYFSTPFISNNVKINMGTESNKAYFDESMYIYAPISGVFFVVLHTEYQISNINGSNTDIFQMDVSTMLDTKVMIITEPVNYLSVSKPSIMVGSFTSCILIVCLLLVLGALVRYRQRNIMKLSQVSFLYAYVIFGILSSASFAYPFYDDAHCKIIKFNIATLTAMYAILIGRLWRINHVLSPLLPQQAFKKEVGSKALISKPKIFIFFEKITDWESWFRRESVNNQPQKNFRRKLPGFLLVRLVVLLTLPPLIVQIYSSWRFSKMDYRYNEGSTSGRKMCAGITSYLTAFSMFYYLAIQIVTIVVAYLTNGLPDRLNETQMILTAAWTTFTFMIVCAVIILIGLNPTTSPDVEYIMRMFACNITVFNTTWHVIMPKIRMARSGNDMKLRSILAERASYTSQRSDTIERLSVNNDDNFRPSIRFAELNKFLDPSMNSSGKRKRRISRCHSWNESHTFGKRNEQTFSKADRDIQLVKKNQSGRRSFVKRNDMQKNILQALNEIPPNELLQCKEDCESCLSQNNFSGYVISKDHMPPRRFISQILSTLDILWRICSVVSSDESPTLYDWHVFRARVIDLSKQCEKARFDWENNNNISFEEEKTEEQVNFTNEIELPASPIHLKTPNIDSNDTENDTILNHDICQTTDDNISLK